MTWLDWGGSERRQLRGRIAQLEVTVAQWKRLHDDAVRRGNDARTELESARALLAVLEPSTTEDDK